MDPYSYYVFNPWIIAILVGLVLLIPTWQVFRRAGLNPAWSLLVLLGFPFGIILALAVLAIRRWPNDPFPREVE